MISVIRVQGEALVSIVSLPISRHPSHWRQTVLNRRKQRGKEGMISDGKSAQVKKCVKCGKAQVAPKSGLCVSCGHRNKPRTLSAEEIKRAQQARQIAEANEEKVRRIRPDGK